MCSISVSSDGPFCRICHEGANGESLLSPCGCTGTLGAVHKSCLERWLSSSNTSYCELCHTEFAVEKRPRPLTEVCLGAPGWSRQREGRRAWGRRGGLPRRILLYRVTSFFPAMVDSADVGGEPGPRPCAPPCSVTPEAETWRMRSQQCQGPILGKGSPGRGHRKCKGPEARKSLVFLMKPGWLEWSKFQEEESGLGEVVAATLGFVGCGQELRL